MIAGHCERREVFGETDEFINAKVQAILANEMTPILCCGETLDEREAGQGQAKVEDQIRPAWRAEREQVASMVIAYEPIWAIGTGKTATADDAQAMCAAVRSVVRKRQATTPPTPFGSSTADR